MAHYRLLGRGEGREDSWGDRDTIELFDISIIADNDEEAIAKAQESIQELESQVLPKLAQCEDFDIDLTMTEERHVRSFRFAPSEPAKPAADAIPAKPARLE